MEDVTSFQSEVMLKNCSSSVMSPRLQPSINVRFLLGESLYDSERSSGSGVGVLVIKDRLLSEMRISVNNELALRVTLGSSFRSIRQRWHLVSATGDERHQGLTPQEDA
jgi:hypothetical protein